MFDRVLIANRGEIAVRVIRTLRALGLESVAVFSDADAGARHVREADTAVRIGPPAAAESYLSAERLLDAARRTGAGAVHPGYGFLSENARFAAACEEAGLTFVGPPARAIDLMGDKIRAKETVAAAGVPVVPGSSGSGLTDTELAAAAREIGMPVLLKPSAGGGGKGMRLVREEALLDEEIAAARREARASFGDDTLLVERWVDKPRHIEIQVLADAHGHVVHLGERECSLQRRHQKIVEEAPSVLLDEATRAAMGEAAVRAARSCGYVGAGTVEFIVPGNDAVTQRSYYFMEMNTRLQVEHPVTELVTGLDLVEWQLRVAAGEHLPFAQEDIRLTGHAVEARLCAEDPARGFLPTGGTVLLLEEPGNAAPGGPTPGNAAPGGPTPGNAAPGGPTPGNAARGVRTDSGLTEGADVGSVYDPMLSKVIAYGEDRATALRRLRGALSGTATLGVTTNAGFLRRLLAHPRVVAGDLDTGLVEAEAQGLLPGGTPPEVYAAAVLLRRADERAATRGRWTDPFAAGDGWRLGGTPAWAAYPVQVPGEEPVTARVRGREISVDGGAAVPARLVAHDDRTATVDLDGVVHRFVHARDPRDGSVWLGRDGDSWCVRPYDPVAAAQEASARSGGDSLTAPMPGTVTVVKVAVGDTVTAGQSLLVVEAMKMEHVITAPYDGTVTELDVAPGSAVAMEQVLAVVTPPEAGPPGEEAAAAGDDDAKDASAAAAALEVE